MKLNQLLSMMYLDTRIQRRFFAISYMYKLSFCPTDNGEGVLKMLKAIG